MIRLTVLCCTVYATICDDPNESLSSKRARAGHATRPHGIILTHPLQLLWDAGSAEDSVVGIAAQSTP